MEKATLIRAMLSIKPNLDKRGYFTSKSLAYSLKVSKARTSVIVAYLVNEGYCAKAGTRDLILTDKGTMKMAEIEADLTRLALALDSLSLPQKKEVSGLLYAYGSTRMLEQLLKGK